MESLKSKYLRHEKFYDKIIKISTILLLVYIIVKYIFNLILPFALGYIVYIILKPLVNYIYLKTKVNKGLISIFSIITFLFIVIATFTVLGKEIYEQAQLFLKSKYYTSQITSFFEQSSLFNSIPIFNLFGLDIGTQLVDAVKNSIYNITDSFISYVQKLSLAVVTVLPKIVAVTIISIVSSFFFLKDEEKIIGFYRKIMPKDYREYITKIKENTVIVTIGYFKAQFILSSITFILCIIGLTLLKNQYAVLLSVLVAFFDMLPFFGAGFILWPTAFIIFLVGDTSTAILTFVLYGVIFLTRQVLEPRTLGKQISLHPLFTLLGIYVGAKIFGIAGIMVGPLTVVLIKTLVADEQ